MKTIDLHKNYILIHKFRYPDEPMKQWVVEDETSIGQYHNDWNELMEVVDKIESLGYDSGICGVVIKNEKLTEILFAPQVKSNTIEVHTRTRKSKIMATYEAVVMWIELHGEEILRAN